MRTYDSRKKKPFIRTAAHQPEVSPPSRLPDIQPPTPSAKSNEAGLAAWEEQRQKWARLGNPLMDTIPNGAGPKPWLQKKRSSDFQVGFNTIGGATSISTTNTNKVVIQRAETDDEDETSSASIKDSYPYNETAEALINAETKPEQDTYTTQIPMAYTAYHVEFEHCGMYTTGLSDCIAVAVLGDFHQESGNYLKMAMTHIPGGNLNQFADKNSPEKMSEYATQVKEVLFMANGSGAKLLVALNSGYTKEPSKKNFENHPVMVDLIQKIGTPTILDTTSELYIYRNGEFATAYDSKKHQEALLEWAVYHQQQAN